MEKIRKKLLFIYFALNGVTAFLIVILTFTIENKILIIPTNEKIWQIILVFFSVITGFISPMWLRIYNFNKFGKNSNATLENLYKFEIQIIVLSWIAFLLTIPAFTMAINKWISYFVAFVGFYSLYYSFPGHQKLKTDKKLFSGTS